MNLVGPDRCSNCGQHVTHLIRFEHGRPVCLVCVDLARDMLDAVVRPTKFDPATQARYEADIAAFERNRAETHTDVPPRPDYVVAADVEALLALHDKAMDMMRKDYGDD